METFIDTENGQYPVVFTQFDDGETKVEVAGLDDIGNNVMVYHRLYPNQDTQLIRLYLLLDLLGKRNISVFTPYLPYSRQDKNRASAAICGLIHSAGASSLYTLDCHFMKERMISRVRGLNIYNTLAVTYLCEFLPETCTLVAPDAGAAHLANGNHFLKKRKDGKVAFMAHNGIKVDKCAAIVDDMISSGSTMLWAADGLKAWTKAESIYFVATHLFDYTDALVRLEEAGRGVITTDSIADTYTAVVKVADIYKKDIREQWMRNIHSI